MNWRDEKQQRMYDEYLERDRKARQYLLRYRLLRAFRWLVLVLLVLFILFVLFFRLYEDGSWRFLFMSGCLKDMLCSL